MKKQPLGYFYSVFKGFTMKSLLIFLSIIETYICSAKSVRFARVPEMDNRIKHGIEIINTNNFGECVKSCDDAGECNSFIYHMKNGSCVLLSERYISFNNTEHEDSWIYFRKRCDDMWYFFRGHCFKRFGASRTWNESKEFCIKEGSWIAEVNDDETVDFLRKRSGSYNWLGGTDFDDDGKWTWYHTNTLITYDGWYPSQPYIGYLHEGISSAKN